MPHPVSLEDLLARSGLTTSQLAMWFGQKLRPTEPMFNMGGMTRLPEDVMPQVFGQAFQALVDRTDAFRTVIEEVDGVPQPRVLPPFPVEVDVADLSRAENPDAALDEWAEARVVRPFDLGRRLFDSALAHLGPGRTVWFMSLHHLIWDGLSTEPFGRRFKELCAAVREGRLDEIGPFPPYVDYARLECALRQSPDHAEHREFWRAKLGEPLEALSFYGRPVVRESTRAARMPCDLGIERTDALRALAGDPRIAAKTLNASLFNVLTAVLFAYLHRVSGNARLSVGTMQHNRLPEFRDTIGMFVGALPLRVTVEPEDTFITLVQKVRDEAIENRRHASGVVMARRQGHFYDVLVNYQVVDVKQSTERPFDLKWVYTGHAVEALGLQVLSQKAPAPFLLLFDLQRTVFDESHQPLVPQHFVNLLDALLANPDQRIRDVEFLTEGERRWLIEDLNRTEAPDPDGRTSDERIAEVAREHGERTALFFEGRTLTYAGLDARANQLARRLAALGVAPETIVAICVERSMDMIVALLGILKAGGAFLPLDPAYPPERLGFMLKDSGARLLVTQSHLKQGLGAMGVDTIALDTEWTSIADECAEAPTRRATLDSLAYVYYTSGSTGHPKGTLLTHRGLCNMIQAQRRIFHAVPEDRVLQFASFSFDMSLWDIFMALGSGAALYLIPREVMLSPERLTLFMQETGITILTLPPTVLHLLPAEQIPSIHTVFSGGERCPAEEVNRWAPRRRFINVYGPTETTVAATMKHCQAPCAENPPIGRPMDNFLLYVLDQYGRLTPPGTPGELYIGGAGLGRGYLGRPELTAERFVPNPFANGATSRLYRTGDLVRYRSDGDLEFLGRTDEQVKIHGYRVELGEIETLLEQCPGVAVATVAQRDDSQGHQRLAAYLVPEPRCAPAVDQLRQHLNARLPYYMVPSSFTMLQRLPLTPSGKVDRRALPEPSFEETQSRIEYVAPRNALERQLEAVWGEVLRLERVGVESSFFELGGDSLGCIQAADGARKQGLAVNPTDLYKYPTISALAAELQRRRAATDGPLPASGPAPAPSGDAPFSIVQPILTGGRKRPIFLAAPAGGVLFPYYNLVPYLDPDRPVHGLQDPGLESSAAASATIEELASRYVAAMRDVQPEGPYLFSGWSFGGSVAFEMAQQLVHAGQEVALVALLDAHTRLPFTLERISLRGLGHIVAGSVRYLAWALRHGLPYVRDAAYVLGVSAKRRLRGGGERPSFPEFLGWAWMDAMHRYGLKKADVAEVLGTHAELLSVRQPSTYPFLRTSHANIQALRRYRPCPYPGKVTLIRTEHQPFRLTPGEDPSLGWGRLAQGGVEVVTIPGNHVVLFRKPWINQCAESLRAAADKADPG